MEFIPYKKKAFERRLTEIIDGAQSSAKVWRVILVFASLCVAVGACYWLGDPTTAEVPFMVSLMNHPFFSLSATAIGKSWKCMTALLLRAMRQ